MTMNLIVSHILDKILKVTDARKSESRKIAHDEVFTFFAWFLWFMNVEILVTTHDCCLMGDDFGSIIPIIMFLAQTFGDLRHSGASSTFHAASHIKTKKFFTTSSESLSPSCNGSRYI
jgi:hypothetical protein